MEDKVGFNQIQGSTLAVRASGNKLLAKDTTVEKFSRLRMTRPLVAPAALEAHMLGKTFVPMYRMREAALRKETEGTGDWVTIGVIYYRCEIIIRLKS